MTDNNAELNSLGREDTTRNRKLSFSKWIDRYDVNLSALADWLDISRTALYNIKSGRSGATLATALQVYYKSGGLVDMFSMLKGDLGKELKEDLREEIRLTHSQTRAKIHKKNRQRRYSLRKL